MNNDEIVNNPNEDSQALLNKIVLDYLKENKWKRRWRWLLRFVFLLVLIILSYQILTVSGDETDNKAHVGLIDINGEIFDGKDANADDFVKGMQSAYKNKEMKALILRINSPGGSPVQAEYFYNTIKYYRSKHPDIKVYAVCVDLCASAAYYTAAAAEEIYASPASMVGSIGVIYNGFGFVDLINKIGVTRRMQTSGANKGFLDPFLPESEQQKQKLQTMLDLIHQIFINRVKEGRGSKLHVDDETFSGMIWTGEQAMTKGLIDGFASSGQLARDIIKVDMIVDYTHKPSLFDRVIKSLGAAIADELPTSLGVKPGLK